MSEITQEELIAYALGEATADQIQKIKDRERDDQELAWQVECLTAVSGLYGLGPATTGSRQTRWRRFLAWFNVRVRRRTVQLACLLLLVVATGSWAAYEVLVPKPLLEDNFNSNWLDPTKWRTARRPTRAEHGYLRLNNRASLVTVQEFPEPVEISFDWRWIDVDGDVSYRDSLTVAVHTSGEHAKTHPFEVVDGIEVIFEAHGGTVTLNSPTDERLTPTTPQGELPMPAGEWHHVRILDDGASITVYLSGPKIDRKYRDKPVFTAKYRGYKGELTKHHIAIYNREIVADALHESHIDNFSVKRLEPFKTGHEE